MQRSNVRRRFRTEARSPRTDLFAIYGALALIAAVVFGTMSYHPF